MAYVYKHIRKDTKEPFYIGVGGLTSFDNYQRANACNWKGLKSRSNFWHNYANLYGFDVEIVLDSCSKEEAFLKEIELIKFYGRQDINTGILVNHTDGGDGNHNLSEENRKKMAYWTGKKKSKQSIDKFKKSQTEKRAFFEKYGIKIPIKPKDLKKLKIKKRAWNKGIPHTEDAKEKMKIAAKNKKPFSIETRLKISKINKGRPICKERLESICRKVIDTSTGLIYDSCKKAAEAFNINKGTLNSRLIGKSSNKTTLIYLDELQP